MGWSAMVAGGTGLVGQALVRRLLADPEVERIVSLMRRPGMSMHAKLVPVPAEFARPALPAGFRPDAAFCALGTTIRKAGGRDAFRAVDHDAVLDFARAAKAAGARSFVVVSSVGADATSPNFYLRVKGEMERDLAALGFEALHVMRPSLLLGKRAELRPAERLGTLLAPLLSPVLHGSLRRYRAIPATTVAAAMHTVAIQGAARLPAEGGVAVHEHDGIRGLGM